MPAIESASEYRADIDGLRAVAVISVILYHAGWLPFGYLGVDVFFVISGYLITGIIYREVTAGKFCVFQFYMRRTRRIIPLVTFVCIVALMVGMLTMLPDDLENLAQSVIATNFFGNNVLQAVTTRNYWDVVNEYKPLLHTWSLAVEEQYYIFYPFVFLTLGRKRIAWAPFFLTICAMGSLLLFLIQENPSDRFYFLQYRFFELAFGGMLATAFDRRVLATPLGIVPLFGLFVLLGFPCLGLSSELRLVLVVLVTTCLLLVNNESNVAGRALLTNLAASFIGRISFSLYMWHQVVFAFARYFFVQHLTPPVTAGLIAIVFVLSVISYLVIERPCRDRRRVSAQHLLVALATAFIVSNGISYYLYRSGGVIHDVPELDIVARHGARGMHAAYNDHIRHYDRPFTGDGKVKVLVVGNSYARDWANVLLESQYQRDVQLSYMESIRDERLTERAEDADIIFVSMARRERMQHLEGNMDKIWSIGPKNFGKSNGYFYNNRGGEYCKQRTEPEERYLKINKELKSELAGRYIDLMDAVIDDEGRVPVFTPNCKFISQDCRHFTVAGAQFFADLLSDQIGEILDVDVELE